LLEDLRWRRVLASRNGIPTTAFPERYANHHKNWPYMTCMPSVPATVMLGGVRIAYGKGVLIPDGDVVLCVMRCLPGAMALVT
jgi:hypothetical protein